MGVTIDDDSNIYIKAGDAVNFTINTLGVIVAELGDTAIFMIKASEGDADVDAILTKNITITESTKVDVVLTTTEIETVPIGTYHWSTKQIRGDNVYTIIPDGGRECYPAFIVSGVLIDG